MIEDAVLVLSELLSNSYRHARPLHGRLAGGTPSEAAPGGHDRVPERVQEFVQAAWSRETSGELTISVTDGGGPTRPRPSTPSVTARGGRGLAIITSLARDWGVDDRLGICPDAVPDGVEALGGGRHGQQCVTVWAVLEPQAGAFGDSFSELDLAELEELD